MEPTYGFGYPGIDDDKSAVEQDRFISEIRDDIERVLSTSAEAISVDGIAQAVNAYREKQGKDPVDEQDILDALSAFELDKKGSLSYLRLAQLT